VERTRAKLRTWAIDCRALDRLPPRADSIVAFFIVGQSGYLISRDQWYIFFPLMKVGNRFVERVLVPLIFL
jgi:hypothetical protein